MKRKLVPGRLDWGGGEGRRDSWMTILEWLSASAAEGVCVWEQQQKEGTGIYYGLSHYVWLAAWIHFTLGWLPLKVDLENCIALQEGLDHWVFSWKRTMKCVYASQRNSFIYCWGQDNWPFRKTEVGPTVPSAYFSAWLICPYDLNLP